MGSHYPRSLPLNISTAALVDIVQYNRTTLVVQCSRQLIGPADCFCHWDPYTVVILEAVTYCSYCNTVEWFWCD